MDRRKILAALAGLLIIAAILSGCTAAPAPAAAQPTPDLDAVRTEAVGTAVAKITYAAALNPSATPVPTNTTAPTVAPTATQAAVVAVTTGTALPSSTATKVVSGGGSGWVPTKTPYTDSAQLISQSPKDGVYFSPGADFDIIWTVKNTGLRDWNSSFYLRYLKGVEGSDSKTYLLPVLKQNDEGSVRVDMVAPSEPGTHSTTWQLMNDDGTAFYTVNLVFYVQ